MSERRPVECKRIPSTQKCGHCVRSGRKCERDVHAESEWKRIDRERERIASQLEEAERQSDELLMKVMRLRKQKRFLESRNLKMLDNDFGALEGMGEESSVPDEDLQEFERLLDAEAAQLAATSNNPSLTQMMNSPSFWENFDSAVAGGIPSPTGGNQSSSR
ncbi:uncharacterized protein ACHE_80498S [Aspergillus chevalieri]|nr:uncharacterized protein ACHE_21447A [Aspergillus chevalieri]XP_043135693.1 uncharacterized protein ACHE_31158S [Aspergillus chevalieri]XP_043140628.1 uncharacterized protein ACHE_80015S [Aspergillus chevalieri]XP_043141111.1 uncharacterized protein ACHE_80498S [Aspergillus chevalieri]BCR85989.1 hypothetical protein ACHE_21447A [Aspergillus chevalieri]BCR87171.1 hypothetical protein ACHE_31158S [Aspergillus chevalieri]BCR92115.1 hypothetical protein ACHE_80015S [Aspergillus chevalieri]BCR9